MEKEQVIDESLYSRQLYVLGKDAMTRMANANILVCGLGGLGVEIAKNVILGGVKMLTLHDTKAAEWHDLSSQYYLTEADIGINRATASLNNLANLNPYVHVKVHTIPLTTEEISDYNLVVVTECYDEDLLLHISDYCHANNIALILAQSNGLFGRVFCDFGDEFVVLDGNGKPPLSAFVVGIKKGTKGTVICHDEHPHGFCDGDFVVFSEVVGMTEINGQDPVKIKVLGPYTFEIDMDTSGFHSYLRNGKVTQVKIPKTMSFKSFRESEQNPKFVDAFFTEPGYLETIHTGFAALMRFILNRKVFPRSWNEEDAKSLVQIAEEINQLDITLKKDVLEILAFVARGNIAPLNGIIGGVAAQEVMKACSGKFTPINQWMYFNATKCLPDPLPCPINSSDFEPLGNRYDGQVAVFGRSFQEKLLSQRWFIVGSGAIGCELLKNFGMMGIGNLVVTDMDSIARSNLNRQFLFRPEDVGQNKALTAKAAIIGMNPGINIEAHSNRVGKESEDVYGENFFASLNGVANALDNVEARLYMDNRCIYYRKHLLESGTLGTKGNTQVIIPHITESYGSLQEPPKDDIPLCTLKSFPSAIEHTLEWARDLFEGLFKQPMDNAVSFLKDKKFLENAVELPISQYCVMVKSLSEVLKERPSEFKDCVTWARFLWEDLFVNQIKQLLFNFPADAKTSSGILFWQAPKRCPTPLEFDLNNDLAIDFIFTAANLRADVFAIERQSRDHVKNTVVNIEVPEFIPQAGVSIATTESEAENMEVQPALDHNGINELVAQILELDTNNLKVNPLEFEKDDDNNLHIDFIVACSNSRASNYNIEHADRLKSKLIAGKIIPAIATTTSVVAGFSSMELYKIVQGHNNINKYSNTFLNLALPRIASTEPVPCPTQIYNDVKWTLWHRFDVEGELTLQELITLFEKEHQLEVTMIGQDQGKTIIYAFFMQPEEVNRLLPLPITEIIRRTSGHDVKAHQQPFVFDLCCNDKNGEDVRVPYVRYSVASFDKIGERKGKSWFQKAVTTIRQLYRSK